MRSSMEEKRDEFFHRKGPQLGLLQQRNYIRTLTEVDFNEVFYRRSLDEVFYWRIKSSVEEVLYEVFNRTKSRYCLLWKWDFDMVLYESKPRKFVHKDLDEVSQKKRMSVWPSTMGRRSFIEINIENCLRRKMSKKSSIDFIDNF